MYSSIYFSDRSVFVKATLISFGTHASSSCSKYLLKQMNFWSNPRKNICNVKVTRLLRNVSQFSQPNASTVTCYIHRVRCGSGRRWAGSVR